jgi:hypothetical protein
MENCGREKAEIAGRAGNVERAREAEWFPGIDGFCARELFQVALDQVGDAKQNGRAFGCRFP